MLAALKVGPSTTELRELDLPVVPDDAALMKVEVAGVCGTDVSQYRLAAHFGTALLILGYTLWLLFGLGAEAREDHHGALLRAPIWVAGSILGLIFLQLLAGALVAGLEAGFGFNTWPLINGAFIPNGLGEASPWYLNPFENPLTVQFDHRMLGYVVVLATIAQAAWLALRRRDPELITGSFTVMCFALLQAALGVWTLLLRVPTPLGLAHQAGAIVLFAGTLSHFWLTLGRTAVTKNAQAVASA